MKYRLITAFPEIFHSFLNQSLIHKAIEKKILDVDLIPLRNFGVGKHRQIDDAPYGGGPGMLMRIEPIVAAIRSVDSGKCRKILFTPKGEKLNQKICGRLSKESELILICPRYEGIDERAVSFVDEEISLGDFILMGGEVAAMAFMESVSRLVPGVLGNPETTREESFEDNLLEAPQYTRPYDYNGLKPPSLLVSGNHAEIKNWKTESAEKVTLERRSDLYQKYLKSSEKQNEQ